MGHVSRSCPESLREGSGSQRVREPFWTTLPRMETFTIASEINASPAEVWDHITSMTGINAELSPLRMTYPPSIETLRAEDVPLGKVLFRSWVLLWGFIPLDRHSLCLTEIAPLAGFHEESSSWLERSWIHDRRITPLPVGCRVTDRLQFQPRALVPRAILRRIVRSTFERRHRRLLERFGPAKG